MKKYYVINLHLRITLHMEDCCLSKFFESPKGFLILSEGPIQYLIIVCLFEVMIITPQCSRVQN